MDTFNGPNRLRHGQPRLALVRVSRLHGREGQRRGQHEEKTFHFQRPSETTKEKEMLRKYL